MVYSTDNLIDGRRTIVIYRSNRQTPPEDAMVLSTDGDEAFLERIRMAYKYIYGSKATVLVADLTKNDD